MEIKKRRFYKIQYQTSFDDICEKIKASPFSENNPIGFELIDLSKTRLVARYIEKQLIHEEIHHPFGEVEEVINLKYIIFYFDIIYKNNGIAMVKVTSPPASLKGFVSKLTEICNNELAISGITFGIKEIYDIIVCNKTVDRFLVKKLKASSIPFGEKTVARMNLISSGNAYEELKNNYKDNQYKLEKIFIETRKMGISELIETSSSGLISYSKGLDNMIEKYAISLI